MPPPVSVSGIISEDDHEPSTHQTCPVFLTFVIFVPSWFVFPGDIIMQRIKMLFWGLLLGVTVGVLLALFFTPRSGERMRREAKAYYEQLLAEARKAAEERRKELEMELGELTGTAEAAS